MFIQPTVASKAAQTKYGMVIKYAERLQMPHLKAVKKEDFYEPGCESEQISLHFVTDDVLGYIYNKHF